MTALRSTVLVLLLIPAFCFGAELRSVTLEKRDGIFFATSEVWIDAPRPHVYEVLADWNHAGNFSSAIVESRNIDRDEQGRPGFYIMNKGCVLFYCVTVERQGYVERSPQGLVRAVADAEKSDFHISDERWYIDPENQGTRVRYEMEMKPKFWIPPVIGPYMIKRKIGRKGFEVLERIEAYVQDIARDDE